MAHSIALGPNVSQAPGFVALSAGQIELCAYPASGAALARLLGCSKMSVTRWRRGDVVPDDESQETIARKLGIAAELWRFAPPRSEGDRLARAFGIEPPGGAPSPAEMAALEEQGVPAGAWDLRPGFFRSRGQLGLWRQCAGGMIRRERGRPGEPTCA